MVWMAAQKELREIWRDGRWRWTLLFLIVLAAVTAAVSAAREARYRQLAADAQAEARAHWLGQGEKNPHSAAHYGFYLFKPQNILTQIDPGVNSYTGVSVFAEAHVKNEADFQAMRDRSGAARFGEMTPAFVLLYIAPLLIVLLGFNAISRERELGTWPLIASAGVPWRRFVLGKWLAAWAAPLLILAATMAVAVLSMAIRGELNGETGVSLALMGLTYAIYFGACINLTLVVSALSRRSATALTVLLACWMLGCFAVPRLAANIAEALYPSPDKLSFAQAVAADRREGMAGDLSAAARSEKLKTDTLAAYGVDSVEDLPVNFDALRMQADETYANRVFDRHYSALIEIHQRQDGVMRAFAPASPLIPARFLSMGFARADSAAHWRFDHEAEMFRRDFVKFLNDDMMNHSKTGDWGYKTGEALWREVPEFKSEPLSLQAVWRNQDENFAILAAWFVLSGVLLFGPLSRRFGQGR